MFILRAILIDCAVILLFCFKVLFFGKKKFVSRPKPNSYPDQTKTEKVGDEVKQNPQFEEKQKKKTFFLLRFTKSRRAKDKAFFEFIKDGRARRRKERRREKAFLELI